MKSTWIPERRAWTPRWWPTALATAVLDVPVAIALSDDLALVGIQAVMAGIALNGLRWAIWRRRHPIIRLEQWAQAQRQAARWN